MFPRGNLSSAAVCLGAILSRCSIPRRRHQRQALTVDLCQAALKPPTLFLRKKTMASLRLFGMRRCLVTAVSRKKERFARPFQTPEQLLQDPQLQTVLQQGGLSADTPITDPQHKIAILAHLSAHCDEPVASDALAGMNTPADIANWYSSRLRPIGARPHARKLIHSLLGDGENLDEVELRIDVQREEVQQELMQKLPANLTLDNKTFTPPEHEGLKPRQRGKTVQRRLRREAAREAAQKSGASQDSD